MTDASANNKRIAKNTLMLYFRMLIIMLVSLYTSRVVLSTLGVVDYGIYNVVGGLVTMMGILNGAMSVSCQRYLTYELGRGNMLRLKQIFSVCLTIFMMLSLIVILLSETVGLWFLHNKMVIPEDRMVAAGYVYQFSILACILSLLTNPFNAIIIAHERMNVYAYVSILEVLLKLGVVYLLLVIPVDRLVTYGALILISHLIVTLCYVIYCWKNFAETHYRFYWEKPLFKELVSYSGWNLYGSAAGLVKGQGLNILLNMFFNPAVNAARGIAYQVNSVITQFFTNFYTAVRPQITKYYAAGEIDEMLMLVFRSSKFSFYLIMIISLPIILEAPYIINLWLGQMPDYVIPFTRLIIVISAVDSLASPLMTTAHATGKIKLYQSTVGTLIIFNLPVSYVLLKLGGSPITVFYVSLCISVMCLFLRLWIVRRLVGFPVRRYIVEVLARCMLICILALIVPLVAHIILPQSFWNVVIVCCISVVSSMAVIYCVGLERHEKELVHTFINKKIFHRR